MTSSAREPTDVVLGTIGDDKLKTQLIPYLPAYQHLLPRGYEATRLLAGVLLEAQKNPKIKDCTPQSLVLAIAQVAQMGLDLGRTIYLIPYFDKKAGSLICTPVADYKGYIELMYAAGAQAVDAREVRAGEQFDHQLGSESRLTHRPSNDLSRAIVAAWAGVLAKRGGQWQYEVMSIAEIELIRKGSNQWNPEKFRDCPWWYARKTPLRRISKYVPMTPQLQALRTGDETPLHLEGVPVEITPELLASLEPRRIAGPAAVADNGYETAASPVPPPHPDEADDPAPVAAAPAGPPTEEQRKVFLEAIDSPLLTAIEKKRYQDWLDGSARGASIADAIEKVGQVKTRRAAKQGR